MASDEYVLRPLDRSEIARLERQHNAWRVETEEVVRAAGFGAGEQLLDVGCGPGLLSLELARLVGSSGSVLGVDSSEGFASHLKDRAREEGLDHVRVEVGDAREFEFDSASLDGAICRWVLMFISEPERVIENVSRALRPGGTFAVMEYAQFRSTSLWPHGRHFEHLYSRVHELIAESGGDADIGARIPSLAVGAGLDVDRLIPIWRVGSPGSQLWTWLEGTHPNHPNLVEAGLLTSAELDAYYGEWGEASRNPAAVLTAPPIIATILRKR